MWDDDDFDPTAQLNERVADAVAVVGIVEEPKKEPEVEKPSQKPITKAKPKSKTTLVEPKDMTKAEIEELQKRIDMDLFAGSIGMEIEKDKSVENVSNAQQDGARIVELEKEIKQEKSAKPQKPAQQPKKKKAPVKEVYEDYVDDDLDQYDDKFQDYY